MCPTASFLTDGGFIKLFQNACMVYKHDVVAAILIYAQRGEDAAKRGGWRMCIKVMEITLLIMENHGKIMEL